MHSVMKIQCILYHHATWGVTACLATSSSQEFAKEFQTQSTTKDVLTASELAAVVKAHLAPHLPSSS